MQGTVLESVGPSGMGNEPWGSLVYHVRQVFHMQENVTVQEDMHCVILKSML